MLQQQREPGEGCDSSAGDQGGGGDHHQLHHKQLGREEREAERAELLGLHLSVHSVCHKRQEAADK